MGAMLLNILLLIVFAMLLIALILIPITSLMSWIVLGHRRRQSSDAEGEGWKSHTTA